MERLRLTASLCVAVVVLLSPISLFSQMTEVGIRSTDRNVLAGEAKKARIIAETGVYTTEDIDLLVRCLGNLTQFRLVFPSAVTPGQYTAEGSDTSLSEEAEKALVRLGRPSVPSLLKALRVGRYGESDSQNTYKAARVLGHMRERSALPRLKELANSGEYGHQNERGADDEVPLAIARIAKTDAYEFLSSLLEMAKREDRVNGGLLEAVGYSEDERSVAVLNEYLKSADRSNKCDVIVALGHTRSSKVPALLEPYINSEDQQFRECSRNALKELGRSDLAPKSR